MNFTLGRKIAVGFSIALALLVLIAGASLKSLDDPLRTRSAWRRPTRPSRRWRASWPASSTWRPASAASSSRGPTTTSSLTGPRATACARDRPGPPPHR